MRGVWTYRKMKKTFYRFPKEGRGGEEGRKAGQREVRWNRKEFVSLLLLPLRDIRIF